jgi:hypothetical protein
VLNAAQTVGAFAVGFSSLPGNYSVSGMRLVADAVGANRAGPVFMYDHTRGDVNNLSYAYRQVLGYLVLGNTIPSALDTYSAYLKRPSLFYIQPDLVMVDRDRAEEDHAYGVTLESAAAADIQAAFPSLTPVVTESGTGAGTPPPWASVLARYVDEKRSDLTPLRAAQRAGKLDPDGQAYMEGVEKALRHLDTIVTRHTGGTR